MEDFVERRKLPRMRVKWPVTLYTPAGEVSGETRDITSTGAYIECRKPLNLNQAYWLQIGIPVHAIAIKGKVIWSNLIIDKSGERQTHTGIFFIQMGEEDRHVLREAILGGGN